MKVWKFPIPVQDEFALDLPVGAQVLHVDAQAGKPCLWALVDPEAPKAQYTFYVRGTGHEVAEDLIHVGSFQLDGGRFVGHLFERPGSLGDLLSALTGRPRP